MIVSMYALREGESRSKENHSGHLLLLAASIGANNKSGQREREGEREERERVSWPY